MTAITVMKMDNVLLLRKAQQQKRSLKLKRNQRNKKNYQRKRLLR